MAPVRVVDHGHGAGRPVGTGREPLLEDVECLLLEAEVDGHEDLETAAALTLGVVGGASEHRSLALQVGGAQPELRDR